MSVVWAEGATPVTTALEEQSNRCLAAYRENPSLVPEHANIERATAQGGYGRRQLYELVQNGADALVGMSPGRITVVLTQGALYCANEGAPLDVDGVGAILGSHLSMKRGTEIGRFGLGFKSVLGVTDRPMFLSRSGSFWFDAEESARRIRSIVPDAERVPVLRLAIPLSPSSSADQDPVLQELMGWATTVVKLPRTNPDSTWLSEDIERFPREFLLFCPHVGELSLDDRVRSHDRVIRLHTEGTRYTLTEGETAASWRVFATMHRPSEAERKDAGELADREELPVLWAVPLDGRPTRGRFWAFFPTEYFTTLSGILNAPWKTNEDRQNLLTGAFNDALIDVGARLVADNLAELIPADDPARHLDLMPARGREAPNWADEELTRRVYECAVDRPSLPDQRGVLCTPATLKLHPAGLPATALSAWAELPDRPVDWCHHGVDTRERRSRAERLIEGAHHQVAMGRVWLEALVAEPTPEHSAAALKVAAAIARDGVPEQMAEVLHARILLTDEWSLVPPRPGEVFIGSDYQSVANLRYVNQAMVSDPAVRESLQALGIAAADPVSEIEACLASGTEEWESRDWELFWYLVRRAGPDSLVVIRRQLSHGRVKVRTRSGRMRSLWATLLPGPIVTTSDDRDAGAVIDVDFHAEELELLRQLGATASPMTDGGSLDEPWFEDYREAAFAEYFSRLTGSKPQAGHLQFDQTTFLGPLTPIRYLSREAAARFTVAALGAMTDTSDWIIRHTSRTLRYPEFGFPRPDLWLLRHDGCLPTSAGARQVRACVSPALRRFGAVLPVAECGEEQARLLELPTDLSELGADTWTEALAGVGRLDEDQPIGAFYAAACRIIDPPETIQCRVGRSHGACPPNSATVVTSRRELEALAPQEKPCVLAPSQDDARLLVEKWGLSPAERSVHTEVFHIASSPQIPLVDEFPGLRVYLDATQSKIGYVSCSVLRLDTLTDTGRFQEEMSFHISSEVVYATANLDAFDVLTRIGREWRLELTPSDVQAIMDDRKNHERLQRLARIRSRDSHEERLVEAVGTTELQRHLPSALFKSVRLFAGELDDLALGKLAMAVYGVDVLREFRSELGDNGLQPPQYWAGSSSALTFVRDLGFPRSFAGFDKQRLDPLLEVDGPPDLPPLHNFQRTIADALRSLLRDGPGGRALMSLPTGAGKTRVAVEALVETLRIGGIGSPVLWVAQTEELCEQAVQTWSYVWRAIGPRTALSISRLWAQNEATPVEKGHQVAVATIAKLQGCIRDSTYDWLKEASCVVIDEAHGSTTPEYTRLLDWLGLGRQRRGAPLVGLTATPFRGTSEAETEALVKRYGGRRLDKDAFQGEPYGVLQEMGVLARVRHRKLDGGDIDASEEELHQLERTRLVPSSLSARLGNDARRTGVLTDSILDLDPTWPVLLFATSVEHAQVMAALLTLKGVPSAAISAGTDPGARRTYIEQFRRGELRVLSNYNVLSQGFDAPAVRAIFVARPTYSPNLYQQMIGRGLRGPKNGGKDECLIVNVADNVRNYKEKLAFTDFEFLWTR